MTSCLLGKLPAIDFSDVDSEIARLKGIEESTRETLDKDLEQAEILN